MTEKTLGKLVYEHVAGKTRVVYSYATYPIKFLHPSMVIRMGNDAVATYFLTYGGGYVDGDTIKVICNINEKCTVVLCTQATTKIFKSTPCTITTQVFETVLGKYATLAYLPEPVSCFRNARFLQKQHFSIKSTSNLIYIDWLTSGRKRNYDWSGDWTQARVEQQERWDFSLYDNSTEIYMDSEPFVIDRLNLQDDEPVALWKRMGSMHVIGYIIIWGVRFQCIAKQCILQSERKSLRNAKDLVSHGRLHSQINSVITSASPLGSLGVIVRFCGTDTEVATAYVREMLSPLAEIIGYEPYPPNR